MYCVCVCARVRACMRACVRVAEGVASDESYQNLSEVTAEVIDSHPQHRHHHHHYHRCHQQNKTRPPQQLNADDDDRAVQSIPATGSFSTAAVCLSCTLLYSCARLSLISFSFRFISHMKLWILGHPRYGTRKRLVSIFGATIPVSVGTDPDASKFPGLSAA